MPLQLKSTVAAILIGAPSALMAMDNPIHLSVINGWQTDEGTVVAGIRLDLDTGWKTYWRAPGDAGIPPVFDFSESGNLLDFQIEWPTPIVFDQGGMRSIGYKDAVIFPLVLTPKKAGEGITLEGVIDLGVCKDVCLPVSLEVDAFLATGTAKRNPALAAAMATRPFSSSEAGVEKTTCKITPTDGGMTLTTAITMPPAGSSEYAVIESNDPDHWLAETESHRDGQTLVSTSFMASLSGQTLMVNRSDLRITVLGSDYAVDIPGCAGS